jgi:phosphoribosylformimino-5-aminoimidazole carboxamide ribotide isomerase
MILFPAIDLKDGACVRLLRGELSRSTVYSSDPAGQARAFEAAGFSWLHIVDLNGAFAGRPLNGPAVAAILKNVRLPVQLGGGIRDMATIEAWLARGVQRVILGTVAVKNPALVHEACRRFPGRIALGIDARGGRVAVEGWAETAEIDATELAKAFEGVGAAAIVHTDIERDGALEGLNVAATAELARAIRTPVIASGGVTSYYDLWRLRACEEDGIVGVVCGRALYDGRIEARTALKILDAAQPAPASGRA